MDAGDTGGEPQPCSGLITSENGTCSRHRFRRTLSQVCATIAQGILLLDLGMMIAVPTVVVGVLHNAKEGLSMDDSQSSWFCSIMLLFQPVGSVLSGCFQGPLGRKRSMLLVNVPYLIAWYLLYSAESVDTLYAASLIMGVGIGFLEAPALAYVGEISEPRLRGILATYNTMIIVLGHLLVFVFGWAFAWRTAMLVSCSVPVITAVAVSLIPESPIWLLTKGRKDEAAASLAWLRGWVSADEVADEFRSLESYCQASENEYRSKWEARIRKSSGYVGVPDDELAVARIGPGFIDGARDLLRPGILKPMQLVLAMFFFFHAASLTAMRPYMIEVFARLEVPLQPNLFTVVSAILQAAGALTCMCLVHLVGKRSLCLVSLAACTFCCLSLGAYACATRWYSAPSIPLFLFCFLYFSINVGISPVPWLLVSEVFPTRGRGVASGVCAGGFYVFAFLVSKTWLNLQHLVDLHGCFMLYGALAGIGILYAYVCLPETEGKTLAEIEENFAGKKKTQIK